MVLSRWKAYTGRSPGWGKAWKTSSRSRPPSNENLTMPTCWSGQDEVGGYYKTRTHLSGQDHRVCRVNLEENVARDDEKLLRNQPPCHMKRRTKTYFFFATKKSFTNIYHLPSPWLHWLEQQLDRAPPSSSPSAPGPSSAPPPMASQSGHTELGLVSNSAFLSFSSVWKASSLNIYLEIDFLQTIEIKCENSSEQLSIVCLWQNLEGIARNVVAFVASADIIASILVNVLKDCSFLKTFRKALTHPHIWKTKVYANLSPLSLLVRELWQVEINKYTNKHTN